MMITIAKTISPTLIFFFISVNILFSIYRTMCHQYNDPQLLYPPKYMLLFYIFSCIEHIFFNSFVLILSLCHHHLHSHSYSQRLNVKINLCSEVLKVRIFFPCVNLLLYFFSIKSVFTVNTETNGLVLRSTRVPF